MDNLPMRIAMLGEDPTKEELEEIGVEYAGCGHIENYKLFYFKKYYPGSQSDYNQCQCAKCRIIFRIPFDLFVTLCFAHYYMLCPDCQKSTESVKDRKNQQYIGIPVNHRGSDFDNWVATKDYQQRLIEGGRSFVDKFPNVHGLFLAGSTGTGKTRMACSVVNEILKKRSIKVRFAEFHMIASQGRMKDAEQKVYNKYDLLCIDDMTKDSIGMEFGQFIYPIINHRYHEGKPTIITSNMGLQKDWLKSTNEYLQRLGDRFKEFICRESFGQSSMRGL